MEVPVIQNTETPTPINTIPINSGTLTVSISNVNTTPNVSIDKIKTLKKNSYLIRILKSFSVGDCVSSLTITDNRLVIKLSNKTTGELVSWIIADKPNNFNKSSVILTAINANSVIGDCSVVYLVDDGKDILFELIDKTTGENCAWLILF
jgi:hypothetical protein